MTCGLAAYALGGISCVFLCFAKCNEPQEKRCKRLDCLQNKCLRNLGKSCMYIFLFPVMCCMCCSDGNNGLDACGKKCEKAGTACSKCLLCCIFCNTTKSKDEPEETPKNNVADQAEETGKDEPKIQPKKAGGEARSRLKKKCGRTYYVGRNCTLHLLVWGLLGFGLYEIFAPGDDFTGSLGDLFKETYNDFIDNFDDATPAPTPQPNIFSDAIASVDVIGTNPIGNIKTLVPTSRRR